MREGSIAPWKLAFITQSPSFYQLWARFRKLSLPPTSWVSWHTPLARVDLDQTRETIKNVLLLLQTERTAMGPMGREGVAQVVWGRNCCCSVWGDWDPFTWYCGSRRLLPLSMTHSVQTWRLTLEYTCAYELHCPRAHIFYQALK